jgi:hypothetical protein
MNIWVVAAFLTIVNDATMNIGVQNWQNGSIG